MRSRRKVVLAAGALAVIVATVVLLLLQAGGGGTDADATTTVPDTSPLVLGQSLGRPETVRVTPLDDGQRITWRAPAAEEGDRYQVLFTDGPSELRGEASLVDERQLDIDTAERVCVVVQAIRDGRVSEDSTEVCSR